PLTLQIDGTTVATSSTAVFTFATATLSPGTHTIVATYSGDSNYARSLGQVTEVVHSVTFPTFYFATGSDAGAPTLVSLFNEKGETLLAFNPLAGIGFTGGARVAVRDVT